jgi:hypothetical protein
VFSPTPWCRAARHMGCFSPSAHTRHTLHCWNGHWRRGKEEMLVWCLLSGETGLRRGHAPTPAFPGPWTQGGARPRVFLPLWPQMHPGCPAPAGRYGAGSDIEPGVGREGKGSRQAAATP